MTSEGRYSSSPAAEPAPEETSTPVKSYSRWAKILVVAGILILLLWAGLKTWRVLQATNSLLGVQDRADTMLAGGINSMNPDEIESLVVDARSDIATLHDELAFTRPIAPLLSWVPRVGSLIEASPYLLEMADAGSEAAALSVTSLKPALSIIQDDAFSAARLGNLLPTLTEAGPALIAAGSALDRYAEARADLAAAVPLDALPWRVRQLIVLSDELLPAAESGLKLAPYASGLLGQDGPRRYLILAQNEDEIRATGGFITGVGVLTVRNGQIVDLLFQDANQVDNWQEKPYEFPPQPLYDFMGSELFLFRDANFWADFPTSAEKAMQLYEYGQDVQPLDGVIAIDQEFLRLLVEGTGPVPVPGTDQTINADNLIRTLQQARNIQEGQEIGEWVTNRKSFLGGFAAAILAKLEGDFRSIDPIYLLRKLAQAADTRHVSVYMRDPAISAALAETGWDGRLPAHPPGDFLMAVDTNMGFNKTGLLIDRAIDYTIDLSDPSAPQGLATVRYRHNGPPASEPCYQGVSEEFAQAEDYLALADQCFWNYLRLYVPGGSQLMESSRHIVPGETMFNGLTWNSTAQTIDEHPGLTTFVNFMLLPQSQELSAFFRYQLPAAVIQAQDELNVYELTLLKQPGLRSEPLRISIQLPVGATLVSADPSPTEIRANNIYFETILDGNLTLTIQYR